MGKSILILLSGGIDSMALAYHYMEKKWNVSGLFIDYGQSWIKEVFSARRIANNLGVSLIEEKTYNLKVGKKYFVPMRNAHILTVAVSKAYEFNIPYVGIGSNRGEFVDQSPEFIDRFNFMLNYCFKDDKHPWVLAPFCIMTKERIFKYALKKNLPIHLTYSCLSEHECGQCASCKLKRKYGVES